MLFSNIWREYDTIAFPLATAVSPRCTVSSPTHFASIQSTLDSWLGFLRYQANVIHRHHLGISIHRSSKRCCDNRIVKHSLGDATSHLFCSSTIRAPASVRPPPLKAKTCFQVPRFPFMAKAAKTEFLHCGRRRLLQSADSNQTWRSEPRCISIYQRSRPFPNSSWHQKSPLIFSVGTLPPSINRIHLSLPRSGLICSVTRAPSLFCRLASTSRPSVINLATSAFPPLVDMRPAI